MAIRQIIKGQAITAELLNSYADGVNELNRETYDKPRQVDPVPDGEVQGAGDESEDVNEFIETSRVISEVQVFDQNDENYALIERIDSITFTNSEGESLKLSFNN